MEKQADLGGLMGRINPICEHHYRVIVFCQPDLNQWDDFTHIPVFSQNGMGFHRS
jgi:hypothetical protein